MEKDYTICNDAQVPQDKLNSTLVLYENLQVDCQIYMEMTKLRERTIQLRKVNLMQVVISGILESRGYAKRYPNSESD